MRSFSPCARCLSRRNAVASTIASTIASFIVCAIVSGVVAPAAIHAQCRVAPVELVDHSRTVGIPYASPADSGASPQRVRALLFGPPIAAVEARAVSYAALVRHVAPGVDAAEHVTARLLFYGATVDSGAVARAMDQQALCRQVDELPPAPRGLVLIVGAFPPLLYEGAAAQLAAHGIATLVLLGNESAARLAINHLAARGWPMDRLVLIGHGAGGPVVQLLAMGHAGVRGVVSLDGFEALDRRRHPGLTGDPGWRPGNLRAPLLHWRPFAHPDQDTVFHAAAARAPVVQVTLREHQGRQWLTAPEVLLTSAPLGSLSGEAAASTQAAVTRETVAFVRSVLAADAQPFDPERFTAALRGSLPARFDVALRPALPTPAIRTDGRLTEAVWQQARTLPDATDVAVRVAEDCDYLYVAIVPRRAAPFITELRIAGGSSAPLLLHTSASLCWAYGKAEVESGDCGKSEAWWGASRTNQAGDPALAEYVVAKRALGLGRCDDGAVLRVEALTGGWGMTQRYP